MIARAVRACAVVRRWRSPAAIGGAILLLIDAALPTPPWAAERQVTIFAAASTAPALEAVIAAYDDADRGNVRPVFAASSTLARQIMNGAPADLFLSANEAWMDAVEGAGLLAPGTRVPLLGNRLVLVAPDSSALRITIEPDFPLVAALGDGRIALGDPAHVPAGVYAREALTCLEVWEEIRPKAVYTGDVRAALVLARRAEVAAAVVYGTDAAGEGSGVRVLGTFPERCHTPIRYPVAVIAGRGRAAVDSFHRYIRGAEAAAIWRAHGFAALNHADPRR